ncbi:FecR family protein [Zobellia sp. 1_MG-2023]|uniref:FecR family protein n=1 Tax=Zobellia sp. 1_MG-2023 TaxID=3062626 RepID=UPI0026E282CD|nr:FecR family protein [Zobellia sp. 1_MG-2023]MDO6818579.1 FecR family protein [Zobellia sp. 1_MG-2023]
MNYHELISKWLDGTISSEEKTHLKTWVSANEVNLSIFKKRIREYNKETASTFDFEKGFSTFNARLSAKKRNRKRLLYGLSFATLGILLVLGGLELLNPPFSTNKAEPIVSGIDTDQEPIEHITITLADGSTKILSSNGSEVLTDADGNIIADKNRGELSFQSKNQNRYMPVVYNEIYIPYGQTFKLKLSDGTSVWLNAGSRLKFPTNFNNDSLVNRTVFLEGEGFFDVTENKKKPFLVKTQGLTVKVLGTQFNVSSYQNEETIATTLVEGKVSINESNAPSNEINLTPSFQANYKKSESNFSKAKVQTELYTAWMQNKLIIDNLKFSEILVKLERIHQVKFQNNAQHLNNEVFKGEFENESIESILNTISLSTPFNYTINQNTITIKSKS